MFFGVWYMSSLMEFIGFFATTRNKSSWIWPHYATATAAMLWSRITALNGAANAEEPGFQPIWTKSPTGHNLTYEDVGLIYKVDDKVIYIRPTLWKSALLYAIIAIQPLLVLIILGLTILLHTMPLDKGLGLVSILPGINHESLDSLTGAALSGELVNDAKLVIHPIQDNEKGSIEYFIASSSTPTRNRRMVGNTIYH